MILLTKQFILASASPRRLMLLKKLLIEPQVIITEAVEQTGGTPAELVCANAETKARAAAAQINGDYLVMGADTVVSIERKILGKPSNKKDARRMLQFLSGRKHSVYSGICLIDTKSGQVVCDYSRTVVTFRYLTEEMLNLYLSTDEPLDKAGAYAIQGMGSLLIDKINGDYGTVVGFSAPLLHELMQQLKLSIADFVIS
ncbi:MAG: Maf family protein [Clostridia bacterium]|nr:Maf family protein [Clostridia bacterium]MDD4798995.1 Maf family protein [Clostridia bacterium]